MNRVGRALQTRQTVARALDLNDTADDAMRWLAVWVANEVCLTPNARCPAFLVHAYREVRAMAEAEASE